MNALAAPFTINTMPEKTLAAFADHGRAGDLMATDGGDAEQANAMETAYRETLRHSSPNRI